MRACTQVHHLRRQAPPSERWMHGLGDPWLDPHARQLDTWLAQLRRCGRTLSASMAMRVCTPAGACSDMAGGLSMSDFLNTQHVMPARSLQAMRPWRQLYCVFRMPCAHPTQG